MGSDKRMVLVIAVVAAFVLHVVLAPYIAIAGAVPDIIAVAAVLISVVRAERFSCVVSFVLGLGYDLLSGGPVGAMALTLLIVSYTASRLFMAFNNDSVLVALLIVAAALLAVEVVYALLLAILGYGAGLGAMLIHVAFPVFAYDLVLAIILYPLMKRLLAQSAPIQSSITGLR